MGYRLRSLAYALGDVGDDAAAAAVDGRSAYVAWAAAVKQAGGVVTVTPHLRYPGDPVSLAGAGDSYAAARYLASFVFPNAPAATLNPLFSRVPDDWSNDGKYVYYLAPDTVQEYVASGGDITTPQIVPGEPAPPMPAWYDDLVKYGKYAGLAIGGLVVLEALSFLPRRR